MLNKIKVKTIITVLGIIFISISINYGRFFVIKEENIKIREKGGKNLKNPKISGSWPNCPCLHIKDDNWSMTDLDWIQVNNGTKDDPHIIENVTIDAGGLGSAILIETSFQYFIIRNCTFFNASSMAVRFEYVSFGKLEQNNINNNSGWGIALIYCANVTILNNNIHNNDLAIFTWYSNNTEIISNNISKNSDGIYSDTDYHDSIIGNSILQNSYNGLSLHETDYVNIKENFINNNSNMGIFLSFCNNATVAKNEACFNEFGIYVRGESCYVALNNISYNSMVGLEPQQSYYSTYYKNLIINNTEGIYVDRTTNTFYFNYLDNINVNVYEDVHSGTNNWDNGSIGNYYSNYTGVDLDGDGIGEDPYYLNGMPGNTHGPDNYPIVWQKSMLSILEPLEGSVFIENAPSFNVSILQGNIISMWYTINNNKIKHFFDSNTTIEQSIWDQLGDGNVKITFYIEDIFFLTGSAQVIVIKDLVAPSINIIAPIPNQVFGTLSPSYNVEIYDSTLDSMWYSLDGGLTNRTFTTNGTIDPTSWSLKSNGSVIVSFYANDTIGRISVKEVTIKKDIEVPIISIIKLSMNDDFQLAPTYEISVIDANLESIWYTINLGEKFMITEFLGKINQSLWDSMPNGCMIIRFYANDTVGNVNFDQINVAKKPPTEGILDLDVVDQLISTDKIDITFFIHNSTGYGIGFATINIWWDGINVSTDIQNFEKGYFSISLETITVESGEAPILLNITIYAMGYAEKYFEMYITVHPCDLIEDSLVLEIANQVFSLKSFSFTFYIHNSTGFAIDDASIQAWWNGVELSTDVQNLGSGYYFISLNPITVGPGEDPILLKLNFSAPGFETGHFETNIAVDPDTLQNENGGPTGEFPWMMMITIFSISLVAVIILVSFWLRRRKINQNII